MTRIENTEWSRMRNSMKTAFANLWKTSRTVLFSVVHDTDTHITHDRLRVGISWVGSMHRLIDYICLLVEKEVPLYMLWKSFDLFLWISECDKNLFWYFNPYKEFFPTVILIFPRREPLSSFFTCLIFWTELLRDFSSLRLTSIPSRESMCCNSRIFSMWQRQGRAVVFWPSLRDLCGLHRNFIESTFHFL